MNIFSKRETLLQNMTYMAMFSAINIIFSVIASFLPIFSLMLILIMPLTSTLVTLFCKNRYYIIYAVASIGLSLVATLYNMEYTILYLIPSILTGFSFGFLIKYKVSPMWLIIVSSIIQSLYTLLSIPLIDFIFSTDIVLFFKTSFSLQESQYINVIVPSFVLFLAMAQMLLSYIIISNEITKFNQQYDKQKISLFYTSVACLLSLVLLSVFSLFYLEISYFLLLCSIYFAAFLIIGAFIKNFKVLLIVIGLLCFACVFLFAFCYIYIPKPAGLLLLGIFPGIISIATLINSILKKDPIKDRIINKEINK